MHNKKILGGAIIGLLIISILANIFFLFFGSTLFVAKWIQWRSSGDVNISGYLDAINYDAPKDWHTIYYIQYIDNSLVPKEDQFFAREVVVSTGDSNVIISNSLDEYDIIEKTDERIMAKDHVFTFEITHDDVFITDKHGKKSQLVSNSIKL